MGTDEFNAGVTLQWTSIPSRGDLKYSESLHATETGISSGLISHLVCMQTLPLPVVRSGLKPFLIVLINVGIICSSSYHKIIGSFILIKTS